MCVVLLAIYSFSLIIQDSLCAVQYIGVPPFFVQYISYAQNKKGGAVREKKEGCLRKHSSQGELVIVQR